MEAIWPSVKVWSAAKVPAGVGCLQREAGGVVEEEQQAGQEEAEQVGESGDQDV